MGLAGAPPRCRGSPTGRAARSHPRCLSQACASGEGTSQPEPGRAWGQGAPRALTLAPCQNDKGRRGRCESLRPLSPLLKGNGPGAGSSHPPGLPQRIAIRPGPDGCTALVLPHWHCSPRSPPAVVAAQGLSRPVLILSAAPCAAAPAQSEFLSVVWSELSSKRGSAVERICHLPPTHLQPVVQNLPWCKAFLM